jgi:hypothetical protein
MTSSRLRPVGLVLATGLVAALAGCKDPPSTTGTSTPAHSTPVASRVKPTTPSPASPALPVPVPGPADPTRPAIELSQASVNSDGKMLSCEVKYRFLDSGPKENAWYVCEAQLKGGASYFVVQTRGKDLKREGSLKNEFGLLQPFMGQIDFFWSEGPTEKGPFTRASNVLTLELK